MRIVIISFMRQNEKQNQALGFHEEAALFLTRLPSLSPRDIAEAIKGHAYIGQERAVKSVSLMAFRHIARLKKIFLEQVDVSVLPQKMNMLFVGPTGCGKTYLIEILFRDILKLPTVIVDMTNYSETGYVGQDVASILTRLLYASELNPVRASFGIVCLDEFDKIASGQNNAVFAGAGTTKDVSGLGVQRELLKLLENTEVAVPLELSHSDYAPKALLSTEHIAFVACGAFSGLKALIGRTESEGIGFGRDASSPKGQRIAVSYTEDDVELTRHFLDYGFLPELIGRFKRVVPFDALSEEDLGMILRGNVLERYTNEFSLHGIELEIEDDVLISIIRESYKKETGARGIEAALIRHLEDVAFDAYSEKDTKFVRLFMEQGKVQSELG